MNWSIPKRPIEPPVSIWGSSVLLAVFGIIYFIIACLLLLLGMEKFSLDELLLRVIMALTITLFLCVCLLAWREVFYFSPRQLTNDQYLIEYADWQHWADNYLILLAAAVELPEQALSAKIVGLQGEKPQATELSREWPDGEQNDYALYRRRFSHLLGQLAESTKLPVTSQQFAIWIYHTGDENELLIEQLKESWLQSPFAQYRWASQQSLTELPTFALLAQWIAQPDDDYRLLLIIDIEGQGELPFACALLLCRQSLKYLPLADMSLAQQPQLLFRPIIVSDNRLADVPAILQSLDYVAEQQPQFLWYAHFNEVQSAVFLQAMQQLPLTTEKLYSVDKMLGNSPTFSWLSLALAAQACQLGRDNHLLAQMQTDQQLQMVRLASQLPQRRMANIKPLRLWYPLLFLLCITLLLAY